MVALNVCNLMPKPNCNKEEREIGSTLLVISLCVSN